MAGVFLFYIGGESMSKETVEVDMVTEKFKAKLKAISTHAGALADELESIDNASTCDECGALVHETTTVYNGDSVVERIMRCQECGNSSVEMETNC